MSNSSSQLSLDQGASYCIIVQGRLDESWSNWFNASNIRVVRSVEGIPATTILVSVSDQAALYGWLTHLRDLGLPLLLVEYIGKDFKAVSTALTASDVVQ